MSMRMRMRMKMRMKMKMRIRMKISLSLSFVILIDSYYWFNRQEILQKAKERYSKEKAAEYYKQNKEVIKEK